MHYLFFQIICHYYPEQVPRLAILTSETDDATGILFPLGRVFSTVFETQNDIVRNECNFTLKLDEADRTAVGHYLPLINHTLKPLSGEASLPSMSYGNMKQIWAGQPLGHSTQFGSTVLTHLNKSDPHNPLLNIRVDEKIISGHNDVFNEKVIEFISLLIELTAEVGQ